MPNPTPAYTLEDEADRDEANLPADAAVILDAAFARIEAMSNEQIIADAKARGVDVHAEAERVRKLLLDGVRKSREARDRLMGDPVKYRETAPLAPCPTYSVEECIRRLEHDIRTHADPRGVSESLLHHLRAAQADAASLLAIAEAAGIVYAADGHVTQPGPTEAIVAEVRRGQEAIHRGIESLVSLEERLTAAAGMPTGDAGASAEEVDAAFLRIDEWRQAAASGEAAIEVLRRESATREREVRAEAWEEGYYHGQIGEERANPYRSGT